MRSCSGLCKAAWAATCCLAIRWQICLYIQLLQLICHLAQVFRAVAVLMPLLQEQMPQFLPLLLVLLERGLQYDAQP